MAYTSFVLTREKSRLRLGLITRGAEIFKTEKVGFSKISCFTNNCKYKKKNETNERNNKNMRTIVYNIYNIII